MLSTDDSRYSFRVGLSGRIEELFSQVDLFSQLDQGIRIATYGDFEHSISVDWSTAENPHIFGDSNAPQVGGKDPPMEVMLKYDGVDLGHGDNDRFDFKADMIEFFDGLSNRSAAVQNFMLSALMNQSFQTKISVYIDNIVESVVGGFLNLTREQMINSVAKIVAHEAAHTLGLLHTARRSEKTDQFLGEIQIVTLSSGALGDTFQLTFNGETTSPLRFDSEAAEVRSALKALSTVGIANVEVTSVSRGGPFTINFVGAFGGLDVPVITVTSTGTLAVDVTTVRNGQVQHFPDSIPRGTTDIMYAGRLDPFGQLLFQPDLSFDALKVGLHLDWTSENAQKTIDLIAHHLNTNKGQWWDGERSDDDPDHGSHGGHAGLGGMGQEGTSLDGVPFPGPRLHVVDSNRKSAWNGVEFGTTLVDGTNGESVVHTLTLRSIGNMPIEIQSMDLQSPSNAFRMEPFSPHTIIPIGGSATVEVRFDPIISGEHEAWIVLTSNDVSLPTRIPLRGVGESPNADLVLDVPNNNVGGDRVGNVLSRENFVTLRNPGSSPLTVTNIRFRNGEEFSVNGLPVGFGPNSPIVLQSGETYSFDVAFVAGAIGLRRDVLEISSNDPLKPIVTKTFVGTGVTSASRSQLQGDDYVAVELVGNEGAPILRQRSDNEGRWSFTLPIDTMIRHLVFDPSSGLISHGFDLTGSTAERTQVTSPIFRASTQNDTDGDGLPDDIELAIGTGLHNVDSDKDGIDDWVELEQGADPLGGRGLPTGVIAAANMQGTASDVVVGTNPNDPNTTWAFVATGFHGLAILDISQANQPVLISELNLSGRNAAIDVDISAGIAVLAADGPGLHFVDVRDVSSPKTIALRATDGLTTAVQIGKTHVYASVGNRVIAVNLDTKQIDASQLLDGDIVDLALDGDVLLALGANGKLSSLRVLGASFTALTSLSLNLPANELYVDRGTAYVAIQEGLATVDYRDPSNLLLMSGPDRPAGLASNPSSYALTGSGLGVYVSSEFPPPDTNSVDVLDGTDPLNTFDFVVRFLLPDKPHALAISHGYAFIANEESGLQVVNFQSLDTEGNPPQVTMQSSVSDEDPAKAGVQVGPGREIRIDGRVVDDVLVRSVELWVNNVRVAVDTSYPWTFAYDTGFSLVAQERVIELRARDTGGNEGKSAQLALDYMPDLSAPVLTSSAPLPGQPVLSVSRIDLNFDEALDPARVSMTGVQLIELGADGLVGGGDDRTIPIAELRSTQSDRTLTALFDPLDPGSYRWLVSTTTIADLSGNQIAAPIDLRFTIPQGNRLKAAIGFPADPTLPSANPGQEISFVVDFGPEAAMLQYQSIDNEGKTGVIQLRPSRSHRETRTVYFEAPGNAYGTATLYGAPNENISSLPHWNTATDAVNILGRGVVGDAYRDILPNNGLYAELSSSDFPSDFSLQSKTEFVLTPGEYEFSMDLAGADSSVQQSMEVAIGELFAASFSRPGRSAFQRQVKTFVVAEATNARVTFKHVGASSRGLILDDVVLRRIGTDEVLLSDSFDLPVTDGEFRLQIVPIVRSVDVTSLDTNNVSMVIFGDGIIEGESTVYHFGNYSLTDISATTGPDVKSLSSTLTIPYSDSIYGDVSITTAGGRSAPFRVKLDSIPSQALSGTATDPNHPSANPGQAIEIAGDNLSRSTEMVVEYQDELGNATTQLINPTWASSDGKRAQLVLPPTVSGISLVRAFGSPTVVPVQIVPTVLTSSEELLVELPHTRLKGRGFFEGSSVYRFGESSVEDTLKASGPDVTDQNRQALVRFDLNDTVDITVTTPGGTSHPVSSQNVDWLSEPLQLTGIEAIPVNGVPANIQLGASNAGQAIMLQGTGFGLETMQVIFPTRKEDGIDDFEAVVPLAVNAAGTRAQVRVPEYAITGQIRVTRIGNRNVGVEPANDTVHRRIRAPFIPSSDTATLRFSDGGLKGLREESWGLDNVRVLQGSTLIYSHSFEQAVGPEWSLHDALDLSGESRVSGPFSNRVQSLNLTGLTAGLTYTLEWDLWVFDSWDGLSRTNGPDQFLVLADQTIIFNETFSNNLLMTQTYATGAGAQLQIVPTITGVKANAFVGIGRGSLRLFGSGFAEGQGAITIGGRTFDNRRRVDTRNPISDPDVIVNPDSTAIPHPNSVYELALDNHGDPFVVDDYIRVTTDGGTYELLNLPWTIVQPGPGRPDRIVSTALRGIPADPNRPSANAAQEIYLHGSFQFSQVFVFDAIDDTGFVGQVVDNSNGFDTDRFDWYHEMEVPALARTGKLRVLGSNAELDLQIVPTLRGVTRNDPGANGDPRRDRNVPWGYDVEHRRIWDLRLLH